ncbi:MAG: hypothetical protein E6713_04825 [Sporomusaceae bacterium]|nr:hypothetical protein [Sporomusaceae bacterium]
MCPFKSNCQTCAVNTKDFNICARFKVAFLVGVDKVPGDMKSIDYHLVASLLAK